MRVSRRRVLPVVAALILLAGLLGPATTAVAAGPPSCRIADVTTKFHASTDWARTLLDTTYRLPKTFRPVGLISVHAAGLSGSGSVRRIALTDLRALVRASRLAGVRLAVRSAYRSYQTQVWTFASWVRRGGIGAALDTSARPGHSEHQLGTTIDFTRAGGIAPWFVSDWGRTAEGAWLRVNAWKFGWVMSYPKGRQAATCYAYEPWHYRYVGKEIAGQVHASGRTLRQVLWTLQTTTPPPTPTPSPTPTATPTPTPTPDPTGTPTPTDEPTPTDDAPAP